MTREDWKEIVAVITETADEQERSSISDDMVERAVGHRIVAALRSLADAFDFKADCTLTDEDRA